MQELELILISTGVLVALAWATVQFLRRANTDHPIPRLLLGVIPGLIGVLLVLISRLDVIPDDLEGPLLSVIVVAVSAFAILGTTYRLARR